MHVVVNNQVGFTTPPREGRSCQHPTDLARAFHIPIFHVNSDDPENVVRACKIAAEWRDTFQRDIVLDLVGYRRNGHNELDDPGITLPLSYDQIEDHPTVLQKYARQLESEGLTTRALIDTMHVSLQTLKLGGERKGKQKDGKFLCVNNGKKLIQPFLKEFFVKGLERKGKYH